MSKNTKYPYPLRRQRLGISARLALLQASRYTSTVEDEALSVIKTPVSVKEDLQLK